MKAIMNVAVVLWGAASPGPLNGNVIATRADLLSRFRCGPDFLQVGDAGDLMCPELSPPLKYFFFLSFFLNRDFQFCYTEAGSGFN